MTAVEAEEEEDDDEEAQHVGLHEGTAMAIVVTLTQFIIIPFSLPICDLTLTNNFS